jgi:ComF family protein
MASMPTGEAELSPEAPPASPATERRAAGLVRPMLGRLADLLLPPVCISCRTRIGSHGLLCGACFANIDFIAPPLCARLGVPLPYEAGEPSLSAAAIASPPVYDRARAAARYSDTTRELIQSFKYRDRQEGLPLFARWLTKAGAELLADAELIVPVPLYPSRLWWRRFNQSAMLALGVGRLTGIAVDCFVLRRVRRTASQVGLTADQRRRNVAGAFRVDRTRAIRVRGKKIVVVDDVITTGATAEACARVLKRAGAARVDILALARAVEPAAFVL